MNRKQKLIVSITGITIVMLALLGLTYGYYLTRIQGNTNNNSISITTADLTLKYDDGTSYINLTNIMPGTTTDGENGNPEPKVFTITNDGSGDVEYSVGIDEVTNTLTRTQDLTYSITCVEKLIDAADTSYSACATTPSNSGEYPKTNSYLFTNQIKQDYIQKYTVVISYANPDEDQSIDMGSIIKGRMQIYSVPESIDIIGTVTGATNGDYVQINSNPKTSVIAEDGTYKLIGVEPGIHTLKVMNGSTTKGTKEIVVKQGTTAGISGNTITFTERERVATVNITSISTNLGVNITEIIEDTSTQSTVLLKDAIMNDTRIIKNEGIPDFSTYADYIVQENNESGEIGMYSTEDDYGTSWYFRGAQSYNYVNFAGFTWRVVRINGDNSIRIILDGSLEKVKRQGMDVYAGNKVEYMYYNINSCLSYDLYPENGDVGYMHGDYSSLCYNSLKSTYSGGSTSYVNAHQNIEDSGLKKEIDKFYETYIENNSNEYHYEKYLSDTLFCGDKGLASSNIGGVEIQLGYGNNDTYYAPYERIVANPNNVTPTLKCDENSTYDYSRYTAGNLMGNGRFSVDTETKKGIKINNDLKYPIATLSIDELVMAGASTTALTTKYNYLYSDNIDFYWYTMSPFKSDSVFIAWQGYNYEFELVIDSFRSVRPVINLRSDVLVDTGTGTIDSPYTVKLPNE